MLLRPPPRRPRPVPPARRVIGAALLYNVEASARSHRPSHHAIVSRFEAVGHSLPLEGNPASVETIELDDAPGPLVLASSRTLRAGTFPSDVVRTGTTVSDFMPRERRHMLRSLRFTRQHWHAQSGPQWLLRTTRTSNCTALPLRKPPSLHASSPPSSEASLSFGVLIRVHCRWCS